MLTGIGVKRCHDGDGENLKKKRLNTQNNNSARASLFLVHFFAVTARLRRENAEFHVLRRTWTQDDDFLFFFLNFDTVFLELALSSRKYCQYLTNWATWNKRDKVWGSATSLFKWRFRSRRRRCCVSSLSKLPNTMNPLTHWPMRDSISSNDHPSLKEKLVHQIFSRSSLLLWVQFNELTFP